MKISIDWLKEYLPIEYTIKELADRLTMIGLEVEDILQAKSIPSGIIVGEITALESHPKSDHLSVCSINIGKKILNVVCGAPNTEMGQLVPLATSGTILNGIEVTETTIRGIKSEGFICSEKELGLGEDHSGILVLNKDKYVVGKTFTVDETDYPPVLDINVTPNRPDCLSHNGVAREIGIILQKKPNFPQAVVKETEAHIEDLISIEIEDKSSCPRYAARIVQNVKIGPSPLWLRKSLEAVNIRSINNVVDITNYVLMETGHPLHGFDYELIQNNKIIVRKAEKNESFTTLDEIDRKLSDDDLLICDGKRGIALAGVMGGMNSEISAQTKHVLIESAYFDPMTIRKTSKKLGLSTEASQRFERGADPNGVLNALDRAAMLLTEIAEGQVAKGIIDIYPNSIDPVTVSLRNSRIADILGIDVPQAKIISILKGLELNPKTGDTITVTVPTFRPDLTREIDLIEEIARHYGYDKIEPTQHSMISLNPDRNEEEEFVELMRDILVGLGFLEIRNPSLVSKDHVTLITPDIRPVKIQNPLNPETEYLRTSLIPNLLDSIQWNLNRSATHLKLFEIGNIFQAKDELLPDEKCILTGAISGSFRSKPFWAENNLKFDFFHMKGIVETVLEKLHITNFSFESLEKNGLNPETSLSIMSDDSQLGLMGEIKRELLLHWDIEQNVFIFNFLIPDLFEILPTNSIYQPIPRFPSIRRDLALVVNENVSVGSIQEIITKIGGDLLHSVDLFDLYKGKQIDSDKKSVAFSLTFLSLTSTLQEQDVDPIITRIVEALQKSLSASLRT